MNLKTMDKEELELLSYTDLTEMILKEEKKSLSTANVFKIICDLLDYTNDQYMDKIGDFYTSLTTDKRFIFLENNEWDLKERHSIKIVLDDEMDDEIDEEVLDDDVEEEYTEEDGDIDSKTDDEIDDDNDDLEDLTVLDEDEIEE